MTQLVSLMSTENEIVSSLSFIDSINYFTSRKIPNHEMQFQQLMKKTMHIIFNARKIYFENKFVYLRLYVILM